MELWRVESNRRRYCHLHLASRRPPVFNLGLLSLSYRRPQVVLCAVYQARRHLD